MALGALSREPFLDNDLVDFAQKCPVRFKLNNFNEKYRIDENVSGMKQRVYMQKTNDGKQIFRDALGKYLGQDTSAAEKQGFSSPDASWFRGESIDFVKSYLLNPNARIFEILDKASIEQLVQSHLSGAQNRRLLIWSLLNLEAWMEQYS